MYLSDLPLFYLHLFFIISYSCTCLTPCSLYFCSLLYADSFTFFVHLFSPVSQCFLLIYPFYLTFFTCFSVSCSCTYLAYLIFFSPVFQYFLPIYLLHLLFSLHLFFYVSFPCTCLTYLCILHICFSILPALTSFTRIIPLFYFSLLRFAFTLFCACSSCCFICYDRPRLEGEKKNVFFVPEHYETRGCNVVKKLMFIVCRAIIGFGMRGVRICAGK